MSDKIQTTEEEVSPKSRLTATLLCWFLSPFGVHRFYVGKTHAGIAMILIGWATLGIWHLVDFILIVTGQFKDADGKVIKV